MGKGCDNSQAVGDAPFLLIETAIRKASAHANCKGIDSTGTPVDVLVCRRTCGLSAIARHGVLLKCTRDRIAANARCLSGPVCDPANDQGTRTHTDPSPQTCLAQSAPTKTALSICGASLHEWHWTNAPSCFPPENIERGCDVWKHLYVAPQHRLHGKRVRLRNPEHVRHCGALLE